MSKPAGPNLIDRVISVFSPQAGVNRMRARIQQHHLAPTLEKLEQRGYEGASRSNRTAGWSTGGGSADAEIAPGLATLRDRHRDLVRNNPYAERAVRAIAANTIGTGIVAQAATLDGDAKKKVDAEWCAWADSTACDLEGRHNFAGIQKLVMRTVVDSGEALVRFHVKSKKSGLRVPLQLQVLEPDYLDTTRDRALGDGGKIIQGIEYGPAGNVVAYWLFPEHPGGIVYGVARWESKRVDASEILHVFRQDRPGQSRGVPWGAPITIRLRDMDEMEDAQLLRQKIAACFVGVVKTPDPINDPTATDTQRTLGRISPGAWQYLQPGEDMQFGTPPAAEGYSDYMRTMIRSIAIAYGVTYETISGDFSQVNFSSARMGWLEFQRNLDDWRWNMLVPAFCEPVWRRFQEIAELVGVVGGEPARSAWTAPRREMIDPTKETEALKQQMRCGLLSPAEAIVQSGYDVEEMLEGYRRFNELADGLGLVFDSDPRKRTNIGYTPEGKNSGGSGVPRGTDDGDDDDEK